MTNSFKSSPVTLQDRFSAWIKEEFNSDNLPQSISSGLLLFFVEAIFVTSFSALIFKGRVGEYLPIALTYILIGDAIIVLVVSLLSSYPGSIAVEQDTPAVIISLAWGSRLRVSLA